MFLTTFMLYLQLVCGIILQMLTLSTERFQKIQKEAPVDCQKYLVQVTKYQAAKNCKVINYKQKIIKNQNNRLIIYRKMIYLALRIAYKKHKSKHIKQ